MSYRVDYSFWKLDVRGYHLTSILWHTLTALGLYGLVCLLYRDRLAAFLAALFFAVHPVHTEAVAYISGRADPMFLFFVLLALIFYIRGTAKIGAAAIDAVLMAICYGAALLCKEHALIFVALAGLYHLIFHKKPKWTFALTAAIITAAYFFYRLADYRLLGVSHPYQSALAERLPGVFAALAQYARLLVMPFGLHMEYGMKFLKWSDPMVMVGIGVFFFTLNAAYRYRRDPKILFPVVWFFVALAPVSNLFTLNASMAEHWIYLPSVGIFMLVALALARLLRSRHRTVAFAGILAALAFFSLLTVRQNTTWRDAVQFYERTLRYEPNTARIYNNLGIALSGRGKTQEAKRAFERAVELNPEASESQFNLGYFYAIEGRMEEAIACYQKAIAINPRYFMAHNNLGGIYEAMGNQKLALLYYYQALDINPRYEQASRNLESLLRKRAPAPVVTL